MFKSVHTRARCVFFMGTLLLGCFFDNLIMILARPISMAASLSSSVTSMPVIPPLKTVFRGNFSGHGLPHSDIWLTTDCSIANRRTSDLETMTDSFFCKDSSLNVNADPCPATDEDPSESRAITTTQLFDLSKGEIDFHAKVPRAATTTFIISTPDGPTLFSLTIKTDELQTEASFSWQSNQPIRHSLPAAFHLDFHYYKIFWWNNEILWTLDGETVHRMAMKPEKDGITHHAFMFFSVQVRGTSPLHGGPSSVRDNYFLLKSLTIRKPFPPETSRPDAKSDLHPAAWSEKEQTDQKTKLNDGGAAKSDQSSLPFFLLTSAVSIAVLLVALGMANRVKESLAKNLSANGMTPYNRDLCMNQLQTRRSESHFGPPGQQQNLNSANATSSSWKTINECSWSQQTTLPWDPSPTTTVEFFGAEIPRNGRENMVIVGEFKAVEVPMAPIEDGLSEFTVEEFAGILAVVEELVVEDPTLATCRQLAEEAFVESAESEEPARQLPEVSIGTNRQFEVSSFRELPLALPELDLDELIQQLHQLEKVTAADAEQIIIRQAAVQQLAEESMGTGHQFQSELPEWDPDELTRLWDQEVTGGNAEQAVKLTVDEHLHGETIAGRDDIFIGDNLYAAYQPAPGIPATQWMDGPGETLNQEILVVEPDHLRQVPVPIETAMQQRSPPNGSRNRKRARSPEILWRFLRRLLDDPDHVHQDIIRWIDRDIGLFVFIDGDAVGELRGTLYDSILHSIRKEYYEPKPVPGWPVYYEESIMVHGIDNETYRFGLNWLNFAQ